MLTNVPFKEALCIAHRLLHEVGPLSDCEPEEFAAEWVQQASWDDFEDVIQEARSTTTYEVGWGGHRWGLVDLEVFLEEWANHSAESCLDRMSPLLTDGVARIAAFVALEAVVRHAPNLGIRVAVELNQALPAWNPPLSEEERPYLVEVVDSIQRLSPEGSGVLDPKLIVIAGLT
jgi:hypothetical protein